MNVNVLWLNYSDAPSRGYWCYGMLEEIFVEFPPAFVSFTHHDSPGTVDGGAVVIIPAEYNASHVDKINTVLSALPWAVVILASDECGLFPVEDLVDVHALWVMTPHFESRTYPRGTKFLGEYYPQDALTHLDRPLTTERQYRFGFSGQITHQRRHEMVQALEDVFEDGYLNKTAGFTQGLGRSDYYELLTECISVPAPSGPQTPDSFRAYEALEAGAVPILDLNCPRDQDGELYWNAVLGEGHPLPSVSHWTDAIKIIDDIADAWPHVNNRVFAWWQLHKRELRYRLLEDIPGITFGQMTVLIPTSVIPSHPNTRIIEETIQSVRYHHPNADILVMIDGVRDEQMVDAERYDEYVRRLLWLCNYEFWNVTPILFDSHQHQANMTRHALDHVRTPTIMFVEHDTPLVTDLPYDWESILRLVEEGHVDMLRFHYEGRIHPEHEHMMLDAESVTVAGVPLRHTVQWSQRPHVAGANFYRWMIREYFPETGRTMIEDRIHGAAQDRPDLFNLAIYTPPGTIVRSTHLDGRETDPKFEMRYE